MKEKYLRRIVRIRGEWHLWIYCCDWDLLMNNKRLAHSESTRKIINESLFYIDGQKLVNIDINKKTGNTVFYFDLGGEIRTKRYVEGDYEQWFLYCPTGNVLTLYNNGEYSYESQDTLDNEAKRKKIEYKIRNSEL